MLKESGVKEILERPGIKILFDERLKRIRTFKRVDGTFKFR
jgi:hypothetical protein